MTKKSEELDAPQQEHDRGDDVDGFVQIHTGDEGVVDALAAWRIYKER
jgi:hypothetical protein